eukprot:g3438.t1
MIHHFSKASFRFFSSSSANVTAPSVVGLIGLGNMGNHMCTNLVKAGYSVQVYDISPEACEVAKSVGASVSSSASDTAVDADVVITMLPASAHVESVYGSANDGDGVLSFAKEGAILIDCSTIDPDVSRKLAGEADSCGKNLRMIDAPVSGGVGGAEQGTLTFMCGGDDDSIDRVTPVLNAMGSNIVRCGPVGSGLVAKICNNLVLGVTMTVVSEAMNLGKKQGLDTKTLANVINTSTGRCWSSDTYNPCPGVLDGVPSSRGYSGGFGSALMLKDLGLAIDCAKSVGSPLPTGGLVHQMYQLQCSVGNGHLDFSSMYKLLEGEEDLK